MEPAEESDFTLWGSWKQPVAPWPGNLASPEDAAQNSELVSLVGRALETLPENQRLAVHLRDVEGMGAEEACAVLDVSPENLRVLLHRGRMPIRAFVNASVTGRADPGLM